MLREITTTSNFYINTCYQIYHIVVTKIHCHIYIIYMWEEMITDMQMCVTCLERGGGIALEQHTHINHSLSSDKETWQCQSSSFGIVCFMTLMWACLQLHQVTKYIKPLELMLWVNAPPGTCSRRSEQEICPFVNPTVTGLRSWMMRPWTAKPVVSLQNTSRILMKQIHLLRIGKAYKLSK